MEEMGNNRYHAKLIRQLAQVGKLPIGGDWFEIVNGFLKTTTEITNAKRTKVFGGIKQGLYNRISFGSYK